VLWAALIGFPSFPQRPCIDGAAALLRCDREPAIRGPDCPRITGSWDHRIKGSPDPALWGPDRFAEAPIRKSADSPLRLESGWRRPTGDQLIL